MVAVVLPWTVRNWLVLDDPILVSVGSGSVFLQGSDEKVFTIDGKKTLYGNIYEAAARDGVERPASTDKESVKDNYMLKVGLHNYQTRLRERPLSFAWFGAHKLVRLWYGTESGALKQQSFLGLFSIFIVPLVLWQIWRWRKLQPQLAALTGVVVLYFVVLHVVTLPQYRYIHPIYPLLLLGTSQFAVTGLDRVRRNRSQEISQLGTKSSEFAYP